MREIIFRAWDKNSETMYQHGYKFTFWEDGSFSVVDALTGDIKPDHPDDNLIIMQYTGLKDKNGVMIFEGDILKPQYKEYYVVACLAGFVGWGYDRACGCCLITDEGIEVIGNIYTTPELIKIDE